jgi:hypothetical protein
MVASGPVEAMVGLGDRGAGWYSGARASVGLTGAPPTGAISWLAIQTAATKALDTYHDCPLATEQGNYLTRLLALAPARCIADHAEY